MTRPAVTRELRRCGSGRSVERSRNRDRPRHRHRHGVTLVQLLVVAGIIAALSGLVLPVVHGARARARFVACAGNLRAQLQAHAAYANDNDGLKPPLWQKRTVSVQFDYLSPDIKWNGKPVGQGLLVQG